MSLLLVVHGAATWFMVGLIWMVQAVHYPLFAAVGPAEFVAYEAGHTRRMGALLAVPAGVEVVTGGMLVWLRPAGVPLWLVLAAGVVLVAVWVITALVQVPLHRRLARGPDPTVLHRLVTSNRWRTAGWSLRGGLVVAMVLVA